MHPSGNTGSIHVTSSTIDADMLTIFLTWRAPDKPSLSRGEQYANHNETATMCLKKINK
jgi:hypothetical protein